MQLIIRGEAVATFQNIATAGATFTFRAAVAVSPADVRVAFINDRYEPQNGIDYNLVVDNISIDGTIYETEAPGVFSTGTWRPTDGFGPGFGRGDTLHGDGYFQYAEPGGGGGSQLSIHARGSLGEETMQLLIDGNVVASWQNVPMARNVFVYNSPVPLSAAQVRVAFTTDLYVPAQGIDRNLVVDRIVLDGVTFESEAATTFSTGTWRPEDGIVPGFGRGEWLVTNGYFQYGGGSQGFTT